MPLDDSLVPSLEIAHVLFMDVVGYSKLPMDQQQLVLSHLKHAVRNTSDFIRAQKNEQLISLPTGDGMALVFFGDPEAPAHCAVELSRALRSHPEVKLRIGMHTGPVYRIADINANRNVSGGGINVAQRVMDCGDAGHILVSAAVADVLFQLSAWKESLHDLGEAEVKHGFHVHIFNLYNQEVGNPERPRNMHPVRRQTSASGTGRVSTQDVDELIGHTLGNYKVLARLGAGGMGVIYEALDVRLGRHVAVKLLPQQLGTDGSALERFRREAALAATLAHPHVCTLYDVGEEAGRQYIVMELLEGHSLRECIEQRPIPIRDLLDWTIQLTDALQFAHSRGIVHRDLKPANIFITNRGDAKILDFGLAKLASPKLASVEERLTTPGIPLGTVAYMSPEQARGEELDERSDIFSLGAVMYEMATRKVPFEGNTSALVFDAILNRAPVAPVTLNPAMPTELQRIVNRALEKDRDRRYSNAFDLQTDLKALKRALETAAEKAHRTTRRNRLARVLLPIAAVLAVGVASALWFSRERSTSASAPASPAPLATSSETQVSAPVGPNGDITVTPTPQPSAAAPEVNSTTIPPATKTALKHSAPETTGKAKSTPPSTKLLTGNYSGRFTSAGVPDLSATAVLDEEHGVVQGCLKVARPSLMGGPFRGVATGNYVLASVVTSSGRLELQGQIEKNEFTGSYVIYDTAGTMRRGQFTFQRMNSDGLPSGYDAANCTAN